MRTFAPLLLLLAAPLAGCHGGPTQPESTALQCTIEAPALATAKLTTDGSVLRDPLGRAVLLRGANAGGRSKWAPFTPFEYASDSEFDASLASYMDTLAAAGFNVLRMPFSWEALEPQKGRYDDAYLARYAKLVDAAWARGMRVLVDFHQDAYASPFSGDGFPLWTLGDIPHGAPHHDTPDWFNGYFDSAGPVVAAFDRFWKNSDGIQDAFEAMWRHMAAGLAGHPGVLGFEVINEPGWGEPPSTEIDMMKRLLGPLVARIAKAVRASIPDALIFEGSAGLEAGFGSSRMPNPTISGFVYAPHYYDLKVLQGGPYLDPDFVDGNLRSSVAELEALGRPVFYGEFGASNASPDQAAYLSDLYDHFDALLVSATVWEVSFTDDDWNHENVNLAALLGAFSADVAQRPVVVRAYPRAIDGHIDSFKWDGQLAISVEQAGNGVSELYVPPVLDGHPLVTLDGGCYSFEPKSGRLLVRASAPRWNLSFVPDFHGPAR